MKRLIAPVFALFLLALLPSAVSASVTQFANVSCAQLWNNSGRPVPFVCLAESADFGGDKLVLTGSSDVYNLLDLGHTLGGLCSPKVWPDSDTWNDCISSVWVKLGRDDSVCLFIGAGYNMRAWRADGPNTSTVWTVYSTDLRDFFAGDAISSVKLNQSGSVCT